MDETAQTPSGAPPRRTSAAIGFALPAAAVLIVILPFCFDGCGPDPDAWRVWLSARYLWLSGTYMPSRFPGFPMQEFLCAPLTPFGFAALNLATACFTAAAAGFLAVLFRGLGARQGFFAALALAFTPVLAIAGCSSIDYAWALAFLLAALCAAQSNRPLLAGILLGLGTGCRITTILYAPVLALLLWNADGAERRIPRLRRLAFAGAGAAALCYLPPLLKFGPGFLRHYPFQYPETTVVLRRGSEEVFGRIGLLGILLAGIVSGFRRITSARVAPAVLSGAPPWPWLAGLDIAYAAYLWIPMEAGYLVPAVPFVLLLAASALDAWPFRGFCALLALSAFLTFGRFGVYEGPLLLDRSLRRYQTAEADRALERIAALDKPAIVVCAGWLQVLLGHLPDARFHEVYDPERNERKEPLALGGVELIYVLRPDDVNRILSEGRAVYFMPGQDKNNRDINGVDLHALHAQPLVP
ncbi:MAG: glycosyltransferase family 39 protein [Planctomycetes bacterium]|nr:glycosyltransferase family 39 protein [Planctomycetota bacterium]